jgi:hypothetical protein
VTKEDLYNWYKPAQLLASTRGEKKAALLPLLHVPGEHVLREVVCTAHSQAKAFYFIFYSELTGRLAYFKGIMSRD